MALIKCPECGKEVSDKANSCPNCGAVVKKKFCQHCGERIDEDCEICPKCGKRVESLQQESEKIIINNSSSSSASSSSSSEADVKVLAAKRYPWWLQWKWILFLGLITGGLYWIIGIIWRILY